LQVNEYGSFEGILSVPTDIEFFVCKHEECFVVDISGEMNLEKAE